MASWGNTDDAANSVFYAANQYKVTANTDNQTALYGNTSAWYGKSTGKMVTGQFFVDSNEILVSSGPIAVAKISNAGSGYGANAAVTLTVTNGGTSGVVNAHANSIGRIDSLLIEAAGTGYKTNPTVAIAAPAGTTFNANTAVNGANVSVNASSGVNATANTIILGAGGGTPYAVGDQVEYVVAAGNTALTNLTSATKYFVSFANSTDIAISATSGGANIDLSTGSSETGHYFTGPLNYITVSSAGKFIANDKITYTVSTGNTAIGGLTSGTTYYVGKANSTVISLKATDIGSTIALTKGKSETGHTVTGETATGYVAVGGAENKGATAGWNLRTAGTGGRAGRVQYECLVAMKRTQVQAGDGSDDAILPDA